MSPTPQETASIIWEVEIRIHTGVTLLYRPTTTKTLAKPYF